MTSIGDVGVLKMSDRILSRVEPVPGQPPPALLTRASFNFYVPPTWVAIKTGFAPVSPDSSGDSWNFGPVVSGRETIIIDYLGRPGVLKLPTGCYALRDLPVARLDKNISMAP